MTTPEEVIAPYVSALSRTDTPLAERVRAACELWRLAELARAALEPFKEELRAEALARLGGVPGVTSIEGAEGATAQVTVPRLGLRLAEPPDLDAARRELGAEFGRVYRVETVLIPRSPEEVEQLSPAARGHLAGRVALVEGKPRVSLSLAPRGLFPSR